MGTAITLTRLLAEKLSKVFAGASSRIVLTDRGYARMRVLGDEAIQIEFLPALTNAITRDFADDRMVSIVELASGRFVMEAIPANRPAAMSRDIYLYEPGRETMTLAFTPKQDIFRDLPLQSLGAGRVALVTATNIVIVDVSENPRALYFNETIAFPQSAVTSGMALHWLEPHPTDSDIFLIACSDGYDSAIEIYRILPSRQLQLVDKTQLPDRAVESAWFPPGDDDLGWSCVEVNQEFREPFDPAQLRIAGSVGLLTHDRRLISVDIPYEKFHGGHTYENAPVDFYRTHTIWLGNRHYVFRTAVGQLVSCNMNDEKMTLIDDTDALVRTLFRLGNHGFAVMESGTLCEVAFER